MNQQSQQGFVALVSAIVISGLLIVVGATLGYAGFFSRFNILDGEFKETSVGLAEACGEIARVEIANDANFANTIPGGKSYNNIDSLGNSCKILPVNGNLVRFQSQAIYHNSYTTLDVTYLRSGNDVSVVSWKEIP